MTRISFRSYSAQVLEAVFAGRTLVYLTIAGQQDGVKSITALLMQGKLRQGDDYINTDGKICFDINKAGNRRLLEPIGEGCAHCVLFHNSVLPSGNMRVLLAANETEAFTRFQQFLETASPLPRLTSLAPNDRLEREMFETFKTTNVISKASVEAGDMLAYTIDTERLFKDEYLLLRETMIETVNRFYDESSYGLSRREVIEALAADNEREATIGKPIVNPAAMVANGRINIVRSAA
jgi:hypothetical protein